MGRRAKRPEGKAKAKQPLAPKAAKKEAARVHELERRLAESLERETATSEILRVISSSPTDVQPVFDTIVANAVKLCDARQGAVYQFDGELVHFVAHHNYTPEVLAVLRKMYPRPPQPDQVSGRAILARAVAQIEDMRADALYSRSYARGRLAQPARGANGARRRAHRCDRDRPR